MFDYCNTEIVVYADDLTFDQAYPRYLNFFPNGDYETVDGTFYYTFDFRVAGGDNKLPSGGTVAGMFPELVGTTIYAFLIRSRGDVGYSMQEILEGIGVCYYVLRPLSSSDIGQYIRLTQSDIPMGIVNPFSESMSFGEDVFFLYDFGRLLTFNAVDFTSLLNYGIKDFNLFSFLFTSGFLIYMGWVVLKFVIPV